jgi:antitoxin component of MazEF toxin-antitoxin module
MENLIYLDTYILQQDMRIRLPKAILSNLGAEKGKTQFDVYLDSAKKQLILIPKEERKENSDNDET